MLKCVMFDLGNTLVDDHYIYKDVRKNFTYPFWKKKGFKGTLEQLREAQRKVDIKFFRNKGKIDYALELGNQLGIKITKKDAMKNDKAFKKYYVKKARLNPYAKYILNYCKKKNLKVVLVSDHWKDTARGAMKKLDIAKYFDYIVISEETGYFKYEIIPFKLVLKKFKLKPEECLMVGDRIDQDCYAKKIGIYACLIEKRWDPPHKLKPGEADYKIKSLKQLKPIIDKLIK